MKEKVLELRSGAPIREIPSNLFIAGASQARMGDNRNSCGDPPA
jgi:hypothetical protein